MLIRLDTLRERLHGVVLNKGEQGYDIKGLQDELDKLPDSYDEFVKFTKKLLNLKKILLVVKKLMNPMGFAQYCLIIYTTKISQMLKKLLKV